MKITAAKNFSKSSIFLAGMLSLALAQSLHAKPGDLDTNFGQNGFSIITAPGTSTTSIESANAVAVQPDGKALIVGTADSLVAILRLNPDGTTDSTFGFSGKVTTDFSPEDTGRAVALLSNGKFIVAGSTTLPGNNGTDFLIARYENNGDLDTTFGTNGLTEFGFGNTNGYNQANALAIQPDGKIIVVGLAENITNRANFGVARLNADGSLDSTFGTGGTVSTDFAGSYNSAYAVVLQSDGKILVAGVENFIINNFNTENFAVARYLMNGVLDTTFGTNGLMTIGYGNRDCVANGIALQSSGKIIVGGQLDDYDNNGVYGGFTVARLNTNGSLDTSFGDLGTGVTSKGVSGSVADDANALLVFTNDSIALVGSIQLSGQGLNYALESFDANGNSPSDIRYSANFSATNYNEQGLAAAVTTNNTVVIVGQTDQNDEGDMGVVGLNGVQSFGQFPSPLPPNAQANRVAVQTDGKIVVTGTSSVNVNSMVLARLNGDGTRDTTFGNGGVVSVSPNGYAIGNDVAIQTDGKIVVAGVTTNTITGAYQFLLARFTATGALDPTFGTGGIGAYTASGIEPVFSAVRIQPDGKIVASGTTFAGTTVVIARFLTNGTPDSTFGSGGFVNTSIGTATFVAAYDLQILPSGKIIAACGCSQTLGAVQVNSDGSLDTTFGTGGILLFNPGGIAQDESIALQSDGKIVIAGGGVSASSPHWAVIRCLSNGILDTNFGIGGVFTITFGSPNTLVGNCVKIQANGKIVVGGGYIFGGSSDFAVFRLLTNGTPDLTFGTNGFVHTAPPGSFLYDDEIRGIAIQANGSIVAAGIVNTSSTGQTMAIARYLGDPMPPVITVPSNIIAEATSASGAVVDFTTSATDASGAVTTTNIPASGSTFPLGITIVTVTAMDTNGTTTNTFTVTVQDTTPPVITLLGANPLTNNIHTAFTDPGATATDTVSGNLTGSIIVTGTVNANHAGTYVLTYTVSDGHGNMTVTNRTVVIVIPPPLLSIALTSLTTNFNASFGLASTVSVESTSLGHGPLQVVAADINGDGKVDLITANFTNETLSVLTNNGSGGFALATTLHTANGVRSLAAVDINGDGKVALIYTEIANNVTVLTNNGSGSFGSNALYIVDHSPNEVVTADVNGDGKPDLVTANPTGNGGNGSLTVLTNNGTGGFGVYVLTVQLAPTAQSVAVADVNGDGKLDLISDNSGGGLAVLTNNGSSSFPRENNIGTGGNYSVVAADVNNDGKVDLISANSQTNTLTVFTNNGAGVFGTNAIYTVGKNPVSVIAADVNNDGWLDLICANTNDNTLTVLTNNGSGGFVLAATLNTGNLPDSVVAADVNGDGGMDLISANFGDDTLTIWTNTPAVVTNTVKHFVISWPWPSTGYVLQQNTNLATANWTTFSGLVSSNSTSMRVTIMPGAGNMFFRLAHP